MKSLVSAGRVLLRAIAGNQANAEYLLLSNQVQLNMRK